MDETYLGSEIPKLGFGLMRLPTVGQGGFFADIDVEQVKGMVDKFIAAGFTYFDTAYVYANGKSEMAARDALIKRYPRESFQLATKLPMGKISTAADMRPLFETSLERTQAGYFDFYLLHALGEDSFELSEKVGAWQFLQELKAEGLIKHAGFSFHDTAVVLDRILTAHPEAEFVQLQINYADWENEESRAQSRRCYEVARKHGKPVIIMEPIKGGTLAEMNAEVTGIFKAAKPDKSIASWALRYAASLEGVITVLSGMSNLAQMEDNLDTMIDFQPLNSSERAVVDQVVGVLKSIPTIACTACQYCVPDCPQKINIPGIFSVSNDLRIFGNLNSAKGGYHWVTSHGGKASDCIACGNCEAVCPQHLPIIDLLKEAAATFENK